MLSLVAYLTLAQTAANVAIAESQVSGVKTTQ